LLREIVSRFGPRYREWAMEGGPNTSSEIVGREAGATQMLARTPRAPTHLLIETHIPYTFAI